MKAESDEIVRKLAAGEIDILVGTHRLLQPTTGSRTSAW